MDAAAATSLTLGGVGGPACAWRAALGTRLRGLGDAHLSLDPRGVRGRLLVLLAAVLLLLRPRVVAVTARRGLGRPRLRRGEGEGQGWGQD